jgi:hypothetical protein
VKNNNSDKIVKQIISNPIDFKLTVARYFLYKIPEKIPQQNHDYFLFEVNADIFLFFCSSVIDLIKREINEKFELFDKENVFYIHGIRKKLADSGNQKRVKQIIANYFTTPAHKTAKSGWDVRQSSLWRLQILRNQVTHGHVLNKVDAETLNFSYTIREYKKYGKTPYVFRERVRNPRQYFEEIFVDLCEFVKKTHQIILPKARSQHHTNWFDFRLD